jgi:diguanylate cyclase (GGDEF)-like protein/PAS domain S-box-containing protein
MVDKIILCIAIFLSQVTLAQVAVVKNKGNKPVYHIGIFDSPPLSSLDKNGNPQGLIVDLINQISEKERLEVEWHFEDWSVMINQVKSNQIDLITSVGFTNERALFMDYSKQSFITVWGQVFLPVNSKIEGLFDLNNKTIAIMKDGVNGTRFKQQCLEFEIKCNIKEVKDYPEVFRLVQSGEVDGGVSNNLVGSAYINDYQMISSSIVFNPFKVYIAAPKGENQELLNVFDQYISNWKDDPQSFYYQTRLKWLQKKTTNPLPIWFWSIILGLGVLAITATIIAYFFNKQVKVRIRQLSKRQRQFHQIINLIPYMIYAADKQGNVLLANKTASDYFGMEVQDFENCNVKQLTDSNQQYEKLLNDNLDESLNEDTTEHREIKTANANGKERVLYLSKTPFSGREDSTSAVVTVAVDITEIKNFEAKIKQLAHFDSLTTLPNRILLREIIDQSLEKSMAGVYSGALLFIDLDLFKTINDSRGHGLGDLLIKEVAIRIESLLHENECVARLGGDEFVVHLPNLNYDDRKTEKIAVLKAEQVLEEIAKPYIVDGERFYMTASIGIVVYPRDGDSQEILLQRADTAMYKAKDNGRNQLHVFNQQIEADVIRQHTLENELRQAEKRGEFRLVYQPIVEGESRKTVGSEALIRWNHPTKGIISPNDFIKIAEQTKLIISIGEWILEEVCRKIRFWLDHGRKDFFIAVNLSVVQIKDETFYSKVLELVHKYNIPKNYLEMEVTESILMKETVRASKVLKQLKLLGIRISIDDFGTGYSSFNYLIKLPLDKIKIDRTFVNNINKDDNSETIIRTIIRMAKELNMDVVAEGIETKAQFEFLLSQSCQYFQGYYFSKPIPFDDMSEVHQK